MKLRKKYRPPGTAGRLNLCLWGGALALWAVCMACITLVTAQGIFEYAADRAEEFQESAGNWLDYRYNEDLPENEERTPGYLNEGMLEILDNWDHAVLRYTGRFEEQGIWGIQLLRDESIPVQTAIVFADREGNVLQTNRDFLRFGYISEEDWQTAGEESHWSGYAWIDIAADDPRFEQLRADYSPTGMLWPNWRYMRFTGVMDGSRMEPTEIAYISGNRYSEAISQAGPTRTFIDKDGSVVEEYEYRIPDLLEQGYLEWEILFSEPDVSADTVTVYSTLVNLSVYDAGGTVGPWRDPEYWDAYEERHTAMGQKDPRNAEYENLQELLLTMLRATGDEPWGNVRYWQTRLEDLIVLDWRMYRMDYSAEEWGEWDFTMYTAYRVQPIRAAAMLLRNVYIGTLLLTAALAAWLRGILRRELLRPVQAVNKAYGSGWRYPDIREAQLPEWAEGVALLNNYRQAEGERQRNRDEIARLNSALEYARSAEANRRQMTSNIAHELKTPLAVVHSYAEGLQAHIAEEKRDKYLEVILSETERMDAMVLEMLELSRLEAGRVKLHREEFSLAELVESVLETLEPAAAGKELRVTRDFPEKTTVSADEARIRQVVENFVTNAVKYTPAGGSVHVRIFREGLGTVFALENDSPPLSEEALGKVWDTFYRVDESRTGGVGTGLGLAIARNIVELHGGSVAVRNTESGVEFRFRI